MRAPTGFVYSLLLPLAITQLLLPCLVHAKWRRHPFKLPSSASIAAAEAQPPKVVLPDGTGTVTGINVPQFGEEAFVGIPYAQPPTGNLRFAKPVALQPDSTRQISAAQWGHKCMQDGVRPDSEL